MKKAKNIELSRTLLKIFDYFEKTKPEDIKSINAYFRVFNRFIKCYANFSEFSLIEIKKYYSYKELKILLKKLEEALKFINTLQTELLSKYRLTKIQKEFLLKKQQLLESIWEQIDQNVIFVRNENNKILFIQKNETLCKEKLSGKGDHKQMLFLLPISRS